ncbi:hypothetical protein H8R18_08645 [Nanchangia anserum]|uniref:Uncharacterized protein n=1 Tax=Nanchangia anserum TaxID=2692125 RepID=A0A8I0GC63_9ACTO|nr:hypothetical protein [Nanchangia anserum]MBD3689581.1 hypothetical protein [Nanchangia anserum]QOX81764.1 hypothetical protein H8R18_08645 [Nanchangia anserum]
MTANCDVDPLAGHAPTRLYALAVAAGVICGTGAFLTIIHAAAGFQVGVLQGIPWGSSLAMASLVAGLAMMSAVVVSAGSASTWSLVSMAVTTSILTFATAYSPMVMATLIGQVGRQLSWSPLIAGIPASVIGATYACGSARRAGAHSEVGAPVHRGGTLPTRLYVRPHRIRTSWGLSLLAAGIAGILLLASVLWLASHTVVDPVEVSLMPSGAIASHQFAIIVAVMSGAILTMSAALSAFGPLVVVTVLMIVPAAYASVLQLITLGESVTRASLRSITLSAPVLGVWGVVVVALVIATVLARRDGMACVERAALAQVDADT